MLVLYQICRMIAFAAGKGKALPICSLVLAVHTILHFVYFGFSSRTSASLTTQQFVSSTILWYNAMVNICGYTLLISLYCNSITIIFNRKLPNTLHQCLPSFELHLNLLKPMEVAWRYATARFRVLPDIIVLGEVRCGTTTLCQHLSSLPGCHPPFSLWKHPELDKKESFYFVGHYLGRVDPLGYSMCFPLRITKWFYQVVLKKPFFTYDGCAQYLTSPTAPYLIARAYHAAGQPPPTLVACVRDPLDQAVSWWRYENNAMLWGSSMGLSEWNEQLRSSAYPPTSISDAIDFSMSTIVENSYQNAENLLNDQHKSARHVSLPRWALTWPSGQLGGLGRNGAFASNILRYERVFDDVFPKIGTSNSKTSRSATREPIETLTYPSPSILSYVNVVPLEYLGDKTKLVGILTSIMKQASLRHPSDSCKQLNQCMATFTNNKAVHRNSSVTAERGFSSNPTKAEEERLVDLFSRDTDELESLCGVRFGWSSSREPART